MEHLLEYFIAFFCWWVVGFVAGVYFFIQDDDLLVENVPPLAVAGLAGPTLLAMMGLSMLGIDSILFDTEIGKKMLIKGFRDGNDDGDNDDGDWGVVG